MSRNELSCAALIPLKPNRRGEILSASAAVTVRGTDATVEHTRMCLLRVTEALAHPPLEAIGKRKG